MTQKTFTLTLDQIADIFNAGVRNGEETQSAADWGCRLRNTKAEDLVDLGFDTTDLTFAEKEELIKEFKAVFLTR